MRKRLMRYLFAACCLLAGSAQCQAGVVSFGSGANQFNMEFVKIGNPGNAADTTGAPNPAGAVGYEYGIGKFEASRDMINKFNASQSLQISLWNMTGAGGNGANKPATGVSWNEAARFVNWLNTSTGGFAAYKFTTGGVNDNIAVWTASDTLDYDASNPYRSKRATYVLPSYNEWYKAAYYNPSNSTYYDFPNGSNTRPTGVASGTATNTAVYGQSFAQGPADVTQAGGLSPYGVMGLGGNVIEWEESSVDLANSSGTSFRGYRGGFWLTSAFNPGPAFLSSSNRSFGIPSGEFESIGFRVASVTPSSPPAVPEPSMMVIGTLFGLGGLLAKRRMKK
ncbi:MAG: SUMF1/EgtB/PvdO family nonheme iron enzyme [Planctomycetaceae bacterium]|nr:SUMF1/EgtB/PvdO family nonheme iron enzyme [Planctomycetaceae bacterium]